MDPAGVAAEGWTRRSVASEPRLSEVVQAYESLGLEVLLVSVQEEGGSQGETGGCTACFGAEEDADRYRVIYTRPRGGAAGDDDLFDA